VSINNKIIIAIDGHSSTGKSTVAKQLAKTIGYTYIDTGAMYRSITWYALQNNIINEDLDVSKLIEKLPSINIRFKKNENTDVSEVYVNDVNVEKHIRTLEVANWVSPVAEISEVRKKLVEQQQLMGIDKGLVMDGRDIGTVVFPNAELKLFMTASADVRAKRRFDEMLLTDEQVSYSEIFENVKKRDHIDSSRKDSPLVKADDAILIDNSSLSKEHQFDFIMDLFYKRINTINS